MRRGSTRLVATVIPPKFVWASLIGAGVAFEVGAILTAADGDTLSEVTREVFQVHTTPGALVFSAAWLGFAAWFWWHIVRGGRKR